MNPVMTNAEFQEAWKGLSFNQYAPDGYWDKVDEQRKKHKFVGRKARVNNGIYECVRAEDDLVIFNISTCSELIISGDEVTNIEWLK